jgi:hypothetical protein
MDPDKFSSELQTWMQESGAVKELRTRLRKEMYDLLLAKKIPNESKNINIKNDRCSKPTTEFDLALNLLIVEHLMQKGMWYTASVMVSEAEFLEEPPEIEVVTTAKKSPNSDKLSEYKRQSPAKLSDETVARISNQIFDFDCDQLLDNVLLTYYRQKDASVMSLMFKFINESLQKVEQDEDQSSSKKSSEEIVKEKRLEKRRMKKEVKDPTTSISTEDVSTTTTTEKDKKKKRERRKQSVDLSIDEKERILKKLQKQLLDARCEIEALAESKVRLSHFQSVIETQNMTLEELRMEIRTLKSRQNQLSDKMIEQPKLTERSLLDPNLQTFVAQIKSSVDELELASHTIDTEFAAI